MGISVNWFRKKTHFQHLKTLNISNRKTRSSTFRDLKDVNKIIVELTRCNFLPLRATQNQKKHYKLICSKNYIYYSRATASRAHQALGPGGALPRALVGFLLWALEGPPLGPWRCPSLGPWTFPLPWALEGPSLGPWRGHSLGPWRGHSLGPWRGPSPGPWRGPG